MIAALYVEEGGCYYGLPDVDPWPESRDARTYAGPWPVVAHPPCERWGNYAAKNGATPGADGGCFAAAIAAVRRWGGVLEHPAGSRAWEQFGLHAPCGRGWTIAGDGCGWVCRIEQGAYGHRARKPTWLYAVGCELPSMKWGRTPAAELPARSIASALARGVRPSRVGGVAILSRKQRRATPLPFRDLLLDIARSVQRRGAA
jgi:hypothetical protein